VIKSNPDPNQDLRQSDADPQSGLRIRIHFIRIWIQHFGL
jgi:hypothetical protein